MRDCPNPVHRFSHQPSRDDLTVFAALADQPRPNLVNLTRWYMRIKRLVDAAFPGAPVGVVFDQIETVGFHDDSLIQEPPTPRRGGGGGAHMEVASRSVSEESARKALEESARRATEENDRIASEVAWKRASEVPLRRASAENARKASEETQTTAAETGRILENGYHHNGDVPVHPTTDETHQEAEAMARLEETRGQTSAGRVSGKSSILLDVKPWDDETDMEALEAAVRAVQLPGLHWGASKLEPVAFKISKLQIMMTIEDDLISPDTIIEEHLTAPPANEHIQSCDVVVWNKICK